MRTSVYPATFSCQIPPAIAEVTSVGLVLLLGCALMDFQVPPALARASNCTVSLNVPSSDRVAPPVLVGMCSTTHELATVQSVVWAVSRPVALFCAGSLAESIKSEKTKSRYFFIGSPFFIGGCTKELEGCHLSW